MPSPDALLASPALAEAALPDLLRDVAAREDPAQLARLVSALAARRDDPAAERVLSVLARTPAAGPARIEALRALRGDDRAPATAGFAAKLGALVTKLPPSPLREKLLRVSEKLGSPSGADPSLGSIGPEAVAARSFAAAYEASRASGDAALVARARDELAPELASHGLAAIFDPSKDAAAFDERPAPAGSEGLGRPAVRATSGAVLVRGVVFVARSAEAPEDPFARAIRAALADPPVDGARESALVALSQALVAKLSGGGAQAALAALREEAARAARSPFVEALEKGLASLA